MSFPRSLGNYLFIDHAGGFRSLYAHLDEIYVKSKTRVSQGEILGSIGNTGFTKTQKLFFCLLNKEETVDPEKYFK